jgi:hypothetical protein
MDPARFRYPEAFSGSPFAFGDTRHGWEIVRHGCGQPDSGRIGVYVRNQEAVVDSRVISDYIDVF